jgi:hypothetical protein
MKYCYCVLAWYFYEDFFESLGSLSGDRFIITHRSKGWLDANPLPSGIREQVRVFENVGLDWGAYHQFVAATDLTPYDFVIFIQDDVVIKDSRFPQRCADVFQDPGIKVIGNGKNGTDWEFRYEKYRDRMFWPDSDDLVVRTVRGSFFAVRTDVFQKVGNFPVYWDVTGGPKQNKANISLRNFGYLITKHFGADAITYLDWDHYLDTPFLNELVRGERIPSAS